MKRREESAKSILAIGAHPDDVVLGAGGVIATLTARGYAATILTLSSGELAGNPAVREREEQQAAEILGASVIFGRLTDGDFRQSQAMRVILDAVRISDPSMVFVHDPADTHQDHVTTANAAIASCRMLGNLLYYEGPSTTAFGPSCTMDISAGWSRKLEAIGMHESQLSARRLVEWLKATAHFRAWPRHVGAQCEAFRIEHAQLDLLLEERAPSVPTVVGDFTARRVAPSSPLSEFVP